jgi:type IV pilus assembly protein PilC
MALDLAVPRRTSPIAIGDAGMRRRVSDRTLAPAVRQLAVLIGAGVAVVDALRLVVEQSEDRRVRAAFDEVARQVERGGTLAEAVTARLDVFPPLAASLVRAGEIGGVLEAVLQRLAAHLEQSARLRRTVLGALAYPAVVVTAAMVVTAVLLGWVVPVFAGAFASAGAELPMPTAVVLALSATLRSRWPLGAVAAAALGATLVASLRTPGGRQRRDRWLLRLPGLGPLLVKAAVARATRTLGTLLGCGVAVLDALDIAARTAGNLVVADALDTARTQLAGGGSLARSLAEHDVIPAAARQMIRVGEHTGTLDVMLARVADACDDDVQSAASTLLAVLEPALILFLGLVIGGLVVSMYLPIFRLGATLG